MSAGLSKVSRPLDTSHGQVAKVSKPLDTSRVQVSKPLANGFDNSRPVQGHLFANARVLDKPVSMSKRLSTPADWPLWFVLAVHAVLASLLATPVIVIVHVLAN